MGRGRPKEDLGADVLIQESTGRVSCQICQAVQMAAAPKWISRNSWTGHLSSAAHQSAVRQHRKDRADAQVAAEQYLRLYNAPPVRLVHPNIPPPTQAVRPQFTFGYDINGIDLQHLSELSDQELAACFPMDQSLTEIQEEQEELLRKETERLLIADQELEFEGAEDMTLPQIIEDLRAAGLEEEVDEDDIYETFTGVPITHDYAPYGSKTMCYLDIFDNLPRLRLSSSQMKMVLWLLRETGARDVPSFKAFRATQKHIRELCGVKISASKSDQGNLFHTTDIRDLVVRDFSNPEVASNMTLYPEEVVGGPISEMWQVSNGRWLELPYDMLPPSLMIDKKRFYIHEIAELANGEWIIPLLWFTRKGELQARAHPVDQRGELNLIHVHRETVTVPSASFKFTHAELVHRLKHPLRFLPEFQDFAQKIPNVNRQIDNGEDLFTVWVSLWGDDVSGAKTKQYQKHINIYSTNACLSGVLLQQEYFIRFISTSPHAGALEQFKPIMNQIKSTHREPVRCFNAATKRPCGSRIQPSDFAGDNPQQSEECSHIGHGGNCKCRVCLAGGQTGFKPAVYGQLYEPGPLRSVQDIRESVLQQIKAASLGVKARVDELQTSTGVKDKIAQFWIEQLIPKARALQAEFPGKPAEEISLELLDWLGSQTDQPYNPLLDVPFVDPSQDTLVEILHTISLGVIKYSWHGLHTAWTDTQRDLFTIRLQSTDINGLNVPPIRAAYIMQYRNALIGKHFKTLMQTAAFHIQDIVSPVQFQLVKALGELGAVLWMTSIHDMETYLADLKVLIDNVLEAFADIDPHKILVKIKLHILLHLPANIRRRGPAVRFATEIYECFNAVFRMCSILSNHQAPSRDIAIKFADLDRVKHLLSGGYWYQDGEWVQAGKDVRDILRRVPIIQQHLGWAPQRVWTVGNIKQCPRKGRKLLSAADTLIPECSNRWRPVVPSESQWFAGVKVTSVSGDECKPGSWCVFLIDTSNGSVSHVGRIAQILTPNSSQAQGLLVVEEFVVGDTVHPHLNMPVLFPKTADKPAYTLLPSKSVQFIINVQHDCRASGCTATGRIQQRQERELSDAYTAAIEHRDASHFIINMHALHNASLLRQFLPQELTKPRPIYTAEQVLWRHLAYGVAEINESNKKATQRTASRLQNQQNQQSNQQNKKRRADNSTLD